MDEKKLQHIFRDQKSYRCFLGWDEWLDKVRKAYDVLINVAKKKKTIFYSELGIGKLGISEEYLPIKIGWILGACSEYEHMESRPLISAIVISKENNRPGKGFWGLSGIPAHLGMKSRHDDLKPFILESEREKFWLDEVERVHRQWQE